MPERVWEITPLAQHHRRDGFDCGDPALDTYLRKYARQNDDRHLTRTYVATESGERQVLGYVALRAGDVACSDLPEDERKGLPGYPVPVVHLARLAVDRRAQGAGLGRVLLGHALRKALRVAGELGVRAVEVIAAGASARGFYARHGFVSLVDDELHMYLPLERVRQAKRRADAR